ncbi:uncharacterized [Tachysurus ichikawai]
MIFAQTNGQNIERTKSCYGAACDEAALKLRFAWSVLWKKCLLLADQRHSGSPHKTLGILSAKMKAGLTTGY